ncbi:MAG: hypothetical protein ACREQ4_18765 [Candidatus Binataceae bacterium]
MRIPALRMTLAVAVAALLVGGTAFAQAGSSTLAPNQTAAFGNGKNLVFTYTENYDCVDQPTDDMDFNGVMMESDPGEFQFPICQVGAAPTQDPTGLNVAKTDKLYVLVPFFSLNDDQNPNDALPCPAGVRSTTLCGPALGNILIQLFGAIPEGFKTTPLVPVQCPNPGSPPGTCTTHASSLDLFPALVALGKIPASPKENIFVPTPNHDHVINMDLRQKKSVWWQVITVLVTDPSDWPAADGSSGITSVNAMQAAIKNGSAIGPVPTNFFLFFGSQVMAGMHHRAGGHQARD